MKIGYARTSTTDQVAGLEAQLRDLAKLGCDKVFQEQLSSVDAKRAQLEAAIDYCRDGDTLVCTKLDRLARSVADVVAIEARLKAKGAALLILDPMMDTSSPAGRLTFNVLASIAQFEREIMLSRQREGIQKAKGEGKYKGRKPTVRAQEDKIKELLTGGMRPTAVAKHLKIARSSVYRIIGD
jgi:DNA invertase Pin-like site-specific DNA recombinase